MSSLFDPAAADLGFKKFFVIIAGGASVVFAYTLYSARMSYPLIEIIPNVLLWWEESSAMERTLGLFGSSVIYVGILFYATLTIYDYLVARRVAGEETTPKPPN